ncbi:MRP1 (YDR347W) [Zygosaccharomyces parabailii]|nr:MRP1 (YDR347W) [Zygosaccharomyces parabailii]CDH13036.1 related to 37S ribosomal protein MRP1,mitochondrial [Zygosaccharomyces bailii ISA1307]
MLKSGLKTVRLSRSYITPALGHLTPNNGLDGVFSSKGLENAWFQRAEYYTEKLNALTKNSEEVPLEKLIYENAKSGVKRNIVNYATLLYNLRFALSSLHGCSQKLPDVSQLGTSQLLKTPELTVKYANEPLDTGNEKLHAALAASFGSILEFRTLLLNSNAAISGDGFTWLVARRVSSQEFDEQKVEFDRLFILNTYNAGTPFNFNRKGHMDELKKQYEKSTEQKLEIPPEVTPLKSKSVEEARQTEAFKDTEYIPLLAIDASPKAWLHDYGAYGKAAYLDRVWESIEWKVVESRLPERTLSHQLM